MFVSHRLALAGVATAVMVACNAQAAVNVAKESNGNSTYYSSQVSATDLINSGQASYASASNTVAPTNSSLDGTHDGVHGAAGNLAGKSWYLAADPETTLTFNLNTNPGTGGSATGYSISDVKMFAGWDSYAPFANQKWTLRVAMVAAPATFIDVQAVDYTPFGEGGGGSSKVALTNFTGTAAAAGVAALQFHIQRAGPAGRGTQGIVMSEIDVMGIPSPASSEPPPAPTGLTAIVSDSQVKLSWSTAIGATSFTIKRSLTDGGPYSPLESNVTATTYTNTGLSNGTPYYYVVSASNSIGDSPNSTQASATPQAQPAAPVRIMCVGDSITAGYTDNPSWNVPFQFGYRSGLYTRLSAVGYPLQFVGESAEPWNGAYGLPTNTPSPDLRTVGQDHHRGYGGWGTAGILGSIVGWLVADNPDVVLLMIGINDGGSVGARANLNSIVQAIVTNKPNARVIVAQITPTASFSQTIVDYNTYIRDTLVPSYQAQGKHVTTVNQYANLLTNGTIDTSLFSNGINHPNAVAYDRMARTWVAGIQAADYLRWSEKYPGVILTNPAADADGDGLSNRQEYAFGLNPAMGSSSNPITDTSALSAAGTFRYTRRPTSGLGYTVRTSTDLLTWQPAGIHEAIVEQSADLVTLEVTLTSPPAGGKLFVRVVAQ